MSKQSEALRDYFDKYGIPRKDVCEKTGRVPFRPYKMRDKTAGNTKATSTAARGQTLKSYPGGKELYTACGRTPPNDKDINP